jgi:hypothetical protein
MKKSIALATLLIFMAAAIAFQYYITSLPELEPPVALGKAWPKNERDGSISASLVGPDGHEFRFGVRGDLESDPDGASVFYIRHPEVVPYVHWTAAGGPDERALFQLLDDWIERNVSAEQRQRLQQNVAQSRATPDRGLATLYEIYRVLRERNQPDSR